MMPSGPAVALGLVVILQLLGQGLCGRCYSCHPKYTAKQVGGGRVKSVVDESCAERSHATEVDCKGDSCGINIVYGEVTSYLLYCYEGDEETGCYVEPNGHRRCVCHGSLCNHADNADVKEAVAAGRVTHTTGRPKRSTDSPNSAGSAGLAAAAIGLWLSVAALV